MSDSVTVAVPAKINLLLGVGGIRPDGFHTLATVYQAIGLYDEVTVSAAPETTLTVVGEGVDVSDVPTDDRNLAARAAALLASRAGLDPARAEVAMTIRKRIPVAGGMAGGSADAAGALLACDVLWGLDTPREDLVRLAAELGSDVPFCLLGGTAGGAGRGEVVTPLQDAGRYWWVVAMPGGGLPTPAVYKELDRLDAHRTEPSIPAEMHEALRTGDLETLTGLLANDLQAAALSLRPELGALLERGRAAGALAAMVSGSGPTCLFLAGDADRAAAVAERITPTGVTTLVASGPVPGAHVVASL